ncbi:MAG: HEPN domain-containing protein [Deltaproteobacteria bacterium]|nr:HEPN domain-containing protein [Deltaproteobacteria bacterium]MBW1978998.1 HEPN domain-containing protein [Deltaproteobacteria bacterium]MBW2045927.1 HEPN domain-containing protein [Deltaproteobacteria bacterium]MBW2300410.1 HEPN domain-containing protein [Deltaproteobacteria bacterium]
MREEIDRWIEFASEDLEMAVLAWEQKIYNQVCFHSQQCVEKLLKGYILFTGKLYPRSHKVADILRLLPGNAFSDMHEELLLLDRFYVTTRYPDALPGMLPSGMPSEEDARKSLQTARLVFDRLKGEMGEV